MNKMLEIEKAMKESLKRDVPEFEAGDTIKVFYKIKDKDKERLHPIEGIVLKVQGEMHRKSFTVRRVAGSESYEITFPYYSPNIGKITVSKKSVRAPRRAKLYYMRDRVGKQAVAV